MKPNCRVDVFFNLENYCCLIVDQKPVHVKVFMPIKAKELFIKENVVKTLMKRKAVKKNFYMYLIENVELRERMLSFAKMVRFLKCFYFVEGLNFKSCF